MKFGIRKPSLKKSIASRTSPKRAIKNALGIKAPRGLGWITDPEKAAYNRVYNRTSKSCLGAIILIVVISLSAGISFIFGM